MRPVSISEEAQQEIHHIMANKKIPNDYGLRVGVKGGRGCAGVNYILGFDKEKDDDVIYDEEGIKVLVSKKEIMFLMGLKLGFYNGSDERGFTFENSAIPG